MNAVVHDNLRAQLSEGLEELEIPFTPEMLSRLLEFRALLGKWNQVFNLTAIREPHAMISHHLLDSLSTSAYLRGHRVLDIGTGAGLPGIPLAILHPDKKFVLIDSNAKKTRFVRQAVLELGLSHVEVIHERVERFQSGSLFDTIITRALAAIDSILSSASHLLNEGGQLLAMCGRMPEHEIVYPGFVAKPIPIRVPGLQAQRHLLVLTSDVRNNQSD